MLLVRQQGDLVAFRVHLQPRASRDGIVGETEGLLKLRVAAPPVDGRANEACLRLLADALDLPISRIRIATGHHSRVKTIQITGASADAIRTILQEMLERLS